LLISRTRLNSIALAQTLSAEQWLDEVGFYTTEPFDPHKIPLITVYGLLSSPIPWLHLQNDLMGDPELRQHYQIWHFIYPPGLPVAFSARIFRDKLEELYHFLIHSTNIRRCMPPSSLHIAWAGSLHKLQLHQNGVPLHGALLNAGEHAAWRLPAAPA